MTASALDSVRGLGEHRRKALVTHFGSVARLRAASVAEITAVPGIGVATAEAVLAALGAESGPAGDAPVVSDPPGADVNNDRDDTADDAAEPAVQTTAETTTG